jgi:hypothetical protein
MPAWIEDGLRKVFMSRLTGLLAPLLLGPGLAAAQGGIEAPGSPLTDGPALTGEVQVVDGPGIKIGEGTVLRPVLGVETGIISNVFFEDSDEKTAGLVRILAEFGIGSLTHQRLQAPTDESTSEPAAQVDENAGDLMFRADARLAYEEYLSGNDRVTAQRDLGVAARVRGIVYPQRTFTFAFEDEFQRETRPTNYESSYDVDRDVNRLRLELGFQPGARRIAVAARYQNTIDYFEDGGQGQLANRLQHTVGLRGAFQWFPYTRVTADASLGFYGPLGDASKVSSMPLRILAGLQSALGVSSTINTRVGFGKGFYSAGPDFTNVLFGLALGYRYSPQARIVGYYDYDFTDSVNANFFRDHAFKLMYQQRVDRFVLVASAELRLRKYSGVMQVVPAASDVRNDLIFAVPISASYNFRDWLAATVGYRFVTDQTDFRYDTGDGLDDPSYTRHELLAGVRAAL